MKTQLTETLYRWPRNWVQDSDLTVLIPGTPDTRYGLVKRALKAGLLKSLKRGLYAIEKPIQEPLDQFEVAQLIYGPSFISFESALSHHQWIPEAVYTITSATTKRTEEFHTPYGLFSYQHVPTKHFYMGVKRETSGQAVYLMASPWRALSDYLYLYPKNWGTLEDIEADLRVELSILYESDRNELELMVNHYPNHRVKEVLKLIKRKLSNVN